MSGAVDRSGCLWFCGMSYEDICNDGRSHLMTVSQAVETNRWHRRDMVPCPTQRWCTERCCDLALPPLDSKIPTADARGEGACDPGPMTALSGKRGNPARDERPVSAGGVSASPANVPPVPAVGQRWQASDTTYDIVGRRDDHDVLICRPIEGFFVEYGDQWLSPSSFSDFTYLGPTPAPTEVSAPAAAPPAPFPTKAAAGPGERPVPMVGDVWEYTEEAPSSLRGKLVTVQRETQLSPDHRFWETGPCGFSDLTLEHGFLRLVSRATDKQKPTAAASVTNRPTRPAGITCRQCLSTSEGGKDHRPTCTRADFLPRDAGLTPTEWSAQVAAMVLRNGLQRRARSRQEVVDRRLPPVTPFVPDVLDDDLFGRPVRP